MSRAANGTYTAPTNSWNSAVEGTTIDESDWNETLADVVDALTDSVSRTGKGTVSAHIDFDENASPGTPASNVGRLYASDVGGATSLMFKDAAGNTYNLLLSSPGLAFSFDTSTDTASDPGNGDLRFNSSTYSSVTEIAIDDLDAIGNNVETFLQALAANTYIFFSKRSGAGIAVFQLVSASNESGFTKLTVSYVDHDGSFAATDPLSLSFGPAGVAGAAGAAGLDWESAWQTSTAYALNDGVSNDGSSYICTQAHTSGASTEPGTGASWASYWDLLAAKGADGAGVGDALVANPLSQFAATTSAQLAGVISDETGTGALVFANSPTLVTPVIGAATGTSVALSSSNIAGHTAAVATVAPDGTAITPRGQTHATDNAAGNGIFRWSADASPARLVLSKSRGASAGTHTVVQSGDTLAQIVGAGSDGTDMEPAASIRIDVDGTPGAGDMPGKIVFSTTADGAEAVTDRFIINAAGKMLAGVASAQTMGNGGSVNPTFQLFGASAAASFGVIRETTPGGGGALFALGSSRSTPSTAGYSALQSGDGIGSLLGVGDNGTNMHATGAAVVMSADGNWNGTDAPGRVVFQTTPTGSLGPPSERMRIDSKGNVVINAAAISTSATDGFLYVPSCAGTPTGTPTTHSGMVPIVVNTSANKLYFYSGGAWRDAGP